MNRFITAAMLCSAACGVGVTPAREEPDETVGSGVRDACPDPSDPAVHYISEDPLACAAAFFACDASQRTFNDRCGCGCIGPKAQPPTEQPPTQEPPTQQAPTEQPPTSNCPDPSDPTVHYISQDPLKCAASFFQCSGNQKSFDNACGCGCID